MSGPLQQRVIICNPHGFHMRPKSAFARRAAQFQSEIRVLWNGQTFNGKSMFELMLAAAPQGDEMTIEVEGPDAAEALGPLAAILADPGEQEQPSGPAPPSISH
jgi:phosphocarrier protein